MIKNIYYNLEYTHRYLNLRRMYNLLYSKSKGTRGFLSEIELYLLISKNL